MPLAIIPGPWIAQTLITLMKAIPANLTGQEAHTGCGPQRSIPRSDALLRLSNN